MDGRRYAIPANNLQIYENNLTFANRLLCASTLTTRTCRRNSLRVNTKFCTQLIIFAVWWKFLNFAFAMCPYLLTIIIPHKDIPELLHRCLGSMPRREDVQVIVADDHSDCDTEALLGQWGFGDVAFCRTASPQGGGAARNLGLSMARGEWVAFVDADDFLTPLADGIIDSLKRVDEKVDVVYCAACSVDSVNFTTSDRADWLNKHISMYAQNPHEAEMRLRYTFGEPWCKIVRRTLIEKHNIDFDTTRIHNDTKYSYLCGHYADMVKVEERALCTITTRRGSVSRTLTEANKLQRIEVFGREDKFFEDNGIPHRYQIRFLWAQMARSLFENRDTFNQGVRMLRSLGIKRTRIVKMTTKHVVRNAMVKAAKGVLKRLK